MAKSPTLYSYNGVELPDINEVWTDKETYPYAFLTRVDVGESVYLNALYVTNKRPYCNEDLQIAVPRPCVMFYCPTYTTLPDGFTEETFEDEFGMPVGVWSEVIRIDDDGGEGVADSNAIWTSHDILNTDGSVYLSATEPIPVYDSTTTSINIGQVSPSPKGDWSEGTLYRTADIVRSGNSLYVALGSSLGVEPGISDGWSNYWMLVASDGQAGDIGKLVNALSSAEKIVNMTVSATSILFSRNPYITKTTNEETGFLNLDFAIPHQGNPPDPVPVTPFFNIDAGSWEVKQITGTGGASYTEESLGVQDFSNLQYNFEEGMTWREFISSAYNVTVGGQFGGVENSMSSAEYATTGRKFAVIFGTDFNDTMEDFYVVCLATIKDTQEDWWTYPNKDMVYLNGTPVYPDDLIISGANYKMGNT